jgi:hypothetical protein
MCRLFCTNAVPGSRQLTDDDAVMMCAANLPIVMAVPRGHTDAFRRALGRRRPCDSDSFRIAAMRVAMCPSGILPDVAGNARGTSSSRSCWCSSRAKLLKSCAKRQGLSYEASRLFTER